MAKLGSFLENRHDRIPAIDGLRTVAVALVFAHHAYPGYFPGGFLGVDVFFVISGFVITRALMQNEMNLRRFYLHRFFRIVPPILPVLLFVMIVSGSGIALATAGEAALAMFSAMNWARAFGLTSGQYLGHFWSLGIEEQFYLIWPLALLLMVRRTPRPAILIMAGVAVLIGWQAWLAGWHGGTAERVYNGLDTRASQLLAGCLLCFVRPSYPLPSFLLISPLAAILCMVLLLQWDGEFYLTAGIPLVAFLSALVVAQMAGGSSRLHRVFESPLLQWGGSRSYAIYLWHYPILGAAFALGAQFGMMPLVSVLASLTLTCAAAEISYRLIERPSRKWRDSLERPAREAAA